MKKIALPLFALAIFIFSNKIKAEDQLINIGLAFPGRRVGGGTRGECSSRKIMHLVPESNISYQNQFGHLALIIGPSNHPKNINIKFKPFEYVPNNENKLDLKDIQIPASEAKVFLISLPKQQYPFIWESSFNCEDDIDMGFDFNFIQNDPPPAQTLIAPTNYKKDNTEEDKMLWLSNYCNKEITQKSLSEKFKIGELFDNNWKKEIAVSCINDLYKI